MIEPSFKKYALNSTDTNLNTIILVLSENYKDLMYFTIHFVIKKNNKF